MRTKRLHLFCGRWINIVVHLCRVAAHQFERDHHRAAEQVGDDDGVVDELRVCGEPTPKHPGGLWQP